MRALSAEAVTTRSPFGLKAAERTGPSCPSKPSDFFGSSNTRAPVTGFQTRAVLSHEVVTTKVPVASKAAEVVPLELVHSDASPNRRANCGATPRSFHDQTAAPGLPKEAVTIVSAS